LKAQNSEIGDKNTMEKATVRENPYRRNAVACTTTTTTATDSSSRTGESFAAAAGGGGSTSQQEKKGPLISGVSQRSFVVHSQSGQTRTSFSSSHGGDDGTMRDSLSSSSAWQQEQGNEKVVMNGPLEQHALKESHKKQSGCSSPSSTEAAAALIVSAADKAGMDGIDRAAIDEIILRESGNSLFMQQQRRRDEKVNEKIAALQERLAIQEKLHADENWRRSLERQIDQEIPAWIAARPVRSVKVVVDMDMFYMACELLSRPELRDVPACVGGMSMITTSNYVARRYGVRSAMPGYIGAALVEQLSAREGNKKRLVFVPNNFELYQEKSRQVRAGKLTRDERFSLPIRVTLVSDA
jgi:hypothetical protein